MADADIAELIVGGKAYSGWKDVTGIRQIDAIAGGFELELSERWDGQAVRWPIDPGDQCELRLAGETVVVGNVDSAQRQIDKQSHRVTIKGRDKTGDLVDCSAIHTPDEFSGLDALSLAKTLAQPFGISVSADIPVGAPFNPFKLQPGESSFEAIERACRMRALLPMSDGRGGMVLTRAGSGRAASAIVEGGNLLSGSAENDWSQRYSSYTVKAQSTSALAEDPDDTAGIEGSSGDRGVNRHRPLLIVAEGIADTAAARERAQWEAGVRAGRSVTVTTLVQGWRQADGALWPLNSLCPVKIPSLDINDTLLITALRFTFGAQGSRTEISMTRPDAFRLIPEIPKGKKNTGLPEGTQVITSEGQLKR
ncbi:phage baseplate assembly protein [Ferrovibrio terrae]|uniref:phage baseplate assembly protein n=1 Tax=Ferrovibrio terrae TaxID=2594003 RepID=UPI003137A92A